MYFEDLDGLAVIDFELEFAEDMKKFAMPDICLADVTQEEMLAGGMLAGKTYADIEAVLRKYDYRSLSVSQSPVDACDYQ